MVVREGARSQARREGEGTNRSVRRISGRAVQGAVVLIPPLDEFDFACPRIVRGRGHSLCAFDIYKHDVLNPLPRSLKIKRCRLVHAKSAFELFSISCDSGPTFNL